MSEIKMNREPLAFLVQQIELTDECIEKLAKAIKAELTQTNAEKQGRWILENVVLTSYPPQYQWHCSECGHILQGYDKSCLTTYCHNCGAKMRKEE